MLAAKMSADVPIADDAEIAGWFRGQPATTADDAEIAGWFRGHPATTANDAEIVGWFRGQPAKMKQTSRIQLTAAQ